MTTDYHQGLDYLLDLDGVFFRMENGYWAMFEVRTVPRTGNTPHGIKYSLALLDRNKTRVLGYDNAHEVRLRGRRCRNTRKVWDRRHRRSRIEPYDFKSANQLLADFWQDVCTLIEESPGHAP